MVIKDPYILLKFRYANRCEWCGAAGKTDAAHVYSKGAGGPDTAFNIVSLGGVLSPCHCHQKSHNGHQPRLDDLLRIVAKRERCTVDDIDRLVNDIRWHLPKNPNRNCVLSWLECLSPRAKELALGVPAISRIVLDLEVA